VRRSLDRRSSASPATSFRLEGRPTPHWSRLAAGHSYDLGTTPSVASARTIVGSLLSIGTRYLDVPRRVSDRPDPELHEVEKLVAWGELFFDLVFVVAVTRVTSLVHADLSWSRTVRALVVFIPVYWAWVGMTMQQPARRRSDPPPAGGECLTW
jgi:hypothetical protein